MSYDATINSANDFAKDYDVFVQNHQWLGTDIMFGMMYEYIQSGQKLLDIGIGTGISSLLFRNIGLKIYGIDGAINMLNLCKEKNITTMLELVDLTKDAVWFNGQFFDHVISHGVFHLIGNLKDIFNRVSSILTTGGYFGFTYVKYDFGGDYVNSMTKGVYEMKKEYSTTVSYQHDDKYILSLLSENTFHIIKKTEFIAFENKETNEKTYFTIIIAQRQ